MSLGKANQNRLAPDVAAEARATLRPDAHTTLADLAHLAALGRTDWPMRQLMALAGYDPRREETAKSVGAYLFFITRREILEVLERWAPESAYAARILRLSACVGVRQDLIRSIRPFTEAQKAAQELHGTLITEPLNALIAARRADLPSDAGLAHWIEELRLFLLLRALELLEAGATHDRFLRDASVPVRKACDRASSDQVKWLRLLLSRTSEFSDFGSDLEHRCAVAKPGKDADKDKPLSHAALQFFSVLRRIAIGGAWWDPKSLEGPRAATPDSVVGIRDASSPIPAPAPAQPTHPAEYAGLVNGPAGRTSGSRFVTHENGRNSTPAQARKHGKEILLQGIEHAMFLPSTWHRLSPTEARLLGDRINELLLSGSEVNRVGAALTLVAWVSARGMFDVETVRCTTDLEPDWTLDPLIGVLRRQPPRFERGVAASSLGPTASPWLHPLAERLEVRLCSEAAGALRSACTRHEGVADIGALWARLSPDQPLQRWFDVTLATPTRLKRLSGPVTAGALRGLVFADSNDAVFAQLLSSQVRTALPAACAYGAYSSAAVAQALMLAPLGSLISVGQPLLGDAGPYLNSAGSQLDADLPRIAKAIRELVDRYDAAATDSARWVDAHNLLTCLVTITLLASTGARPVNSPFELRSWLDLNRAFAYVEDKRAGPTTGARICVLSRRAVELLQEIYLPHLQALANMLRPTCPKLAAAIEQAILASGSDDRPLPFLFFLRPPPDFGWIEVSESQLDAHCGVEWLLPWNIFRHLSAIHLARGRLHPEVVDALLAHGDRGAESHGDHSMRLPRDDIETARPHIDDLQLAYGLKVPSSLPALPTRLGPSYPDLQPDANRQYGSRARATDRQRRNEDARNLALNAILRAVGDRPPQSLTPEEVQAIGHDMLFRSTGMPHPAATVRYEVFEEWLGSAWKSLRALVNLRRHYRPVPEPAPLFTPVLLTAESELEAATRSFRSITAPLDTGAKTPGPMIAAVLGAFELVLSCRFAEPATLLDLTHLRRNVRLVRFDGRYWLERAKADLWVDGRPVRRVELTGRAARWIGIALSATHREVAEANVPQLLQTWVRNHAGGSSTLGTALRHLCLRRNQLNAWTLPGIEAAHLSGRQFMSGLPHHDWYRLSRGCAAALPALVTEQPEYEDSEETYAVPVGDPKSVTKDTLSAKRCATLLDGITVVFETLAHDVRAAIAEIRRLTASSGFARGDAPQVLAHFACQLLTRKRRIGKKVRLRAPTSRRYWYSLVGPFTDLAHDRCLVDEDEESIREFYEDIILWWDAHVDDADTALPGIAPPADVQMTEEERREISKQDAVRRTVAQLKDFQDFAVRAYGVEDVDWSGIDLGAKAAVGRPALILESEFEAALDSLLRQSDLTTLPDLMLSTAFTLILCARFGLRVSEAVGLYRDDWLDYEGAVVVLVRSNQVRTLKTANSRRQVPLLERLGTTSTQVVAEVIRRWELAHRAGESAPILPGVTPDDYRAVKAAVSSNLLDLLKQVTRSEAARVHGLRHAYATRVFAMLRGLPIGKGLQIRESETIHVRRLLLGSNNLDRRTLWAVARLLGHANPTTTIRCYLHALELMMAPPLNESTWDGADIKPHGLVDLDAVAIDSLYGSPPELSDEDPLPPESLALRRIRCLALIASGYKPDRALLSSRLTPLEFDDFINLLEQLPGHGATGRTIATDSKLLKSISIARWRELANFVAKSAPVQLTLDPETMGLGLPIGPRRQLVVHLREHVGKVAEFIASLGLKPIDLRLVTVKGMHQAKLGWINDAGLGPFVVRLEDAGKDFRIDSAEHGDPPEPVTHRAALVPTADLARRIQTTQELLVLWASMHTRQPQQETEQAIQVATESSDNSASQKSST